MEKLPYQYNGYSLEESPLIAAAALIRETRGYNALVQFAQESGIDRDTLFELMLPSSIFVGREKPQRNKIVKLLVWEGHKPVEIAQMLGFKGSDREKKYQVRSSLTATNLPTKKERVLLQRENPRIQKLLEELYVLTTQDLNKSTLLLDNLEIDEKIHTILETTEFTVKDLSCMTGWSAYTLNRHLDRRLERVRCLLPKENLPRKASNIARAA